MTEHNNFIGMDGFVWFYGVVEDRQDPYMIGRVKVRCFAHHTGDKTTLPTSDLPWAQVVGETGTSGIGSFRTFYPDSFVFGTFIDGSNRQIPIILGAVPYKSMPSTTQTDDPRNESQYNSSRPGRPTNYLSVEEKNSNDQSQ